MKTLSAKSAAALDQDLMTVGAFSLDQLMELAGLSVSQASMCDRNLGPLVPQGCSDPNLCQFIAFILRAEVAAS